MITKTSQTAKFSGSFLLYGFQSKEETEEFVQNLIIDMKAPVLAYDAGEVENTEAAAILIKDKFNPTIRERFTNEKQTNEGLTLEVDEERTDETLKTYGLTISQAGIALSQGNIENINPHLIQNLIQKLAGKTPENLEKGFTVLVKLCQKFFGETFQKIKAYKTLKSDVAEDLLFKIGAKAYEITDWGLEAEE